MGAGYSTTYDKKNDWEVKINFEEDDTKIQYVLGSHSQYVDKTVIGAAGSEVKFTSDLITVKMKQSGIDCGLDGNMIQLKDHTLDVITQMQSLLTNNYTNVKEDDKMESTEPVEVVNRTLSNKPIHA